MIVLLLLVVVVGVVFVRLGAWQWDRAGIRGQEAAAAEQAERLAADPVPIEDVIAPQVSLTADELGRRVAVTGRFEPDQQVLVPGRQVGGVDAVLVVTGLAVTEGPHAGAIMPVLRGWVPASDLTRLEAGAGTPEGAARLAVPDPASGTVEVIGLLNASEAASDAPLPPGEVGAISTGQLTNVWGGPMYSGYLVLEEPVQAGLQPMPPPSVDDPELNLQSLFYAFEWWIFAGFAAFMWWRVLRDDVREDRAGTAASASARPATGA